MPTPSLIQIAPGTLCWFRGSADHPNNGALVEVTRHCDLFADHGKFWFIKAKVQMHVILIATEGSAKAAGKTIWPAGTEIAAKESWLVPIAGPGLVDEVAAYGKAWQDEKRAVRAVSYGASHTKLYNTASRSTPNVRR